MTVRRRVRESAAPGAPTVSEQLEGRLLLATASLVRDLALHTDAAIADHVIGESVRAKGGTGPAPSFSLSATLLDGESLGNSPPSLPAD